MMIKERNGLHLHALRFAATFQLARAPIITDVKKESEGPAEIIPAASRPNHRRTTFKKNIQACKESQEDIKKNTV